MTQDDYQERAYFFYERQRFREAAEVCLEGLGVDPNDADLLYMRGLCGFQLHDPELTQSSIEALAACAPNWSGTHDLLCYRALDENRLDAAERHAREAIRWDPQEGSRHGTLACVFDRLGRIEDAITSARRGLSLDPNSIDLLTLLQRLYQLNGEPRLAAEMERRAGEVNPEDADWHLFAGLRLLEAGQNAEARSRMRSSLMVQPNVPRERLDAMAQEIVLAHRFFKHGFFLNNNWRFRAMAVATPCVWFALGWIVWFPFRWLGWMSVILVVGWFAYEAIFRLCCRLVRRRIERGRL
jgi:tetratricopeptide (TPR) repeat protein